MGAKRRAKSLSAVSGMFSKKGASKPSHILHPQPPRDFHESWAVKLVHSFLNAGVLWNCWPKYGQLRR
ncbi:Uncharacterized protein HZ326_23440 [Fusarium oxysporum f. sp. albedinis]|nr:Uncharacterized protein HZ326_23440 [Fusarium oxysporum f. sp. albedinis]